jgi:hypothetical protein
MSIVHMVGFDERFSMDQEFSTHNWPASTDFLTTSGDNYQGVGATLRVNATNADTDTNEFYWGRLPLAGADPHLAVSANTRQIVGTNPAPAFAMTVRRGGSVLTIRRVGSTDNFLTVTSSGMDGDQIDDTLHVGSSVVTTRYFWSFIVEELGDGGLRVAVIRNGSTTDVADYQSTDWPSGDWENIDVGLVVRDTASGAGDSIDDIIVGHDIIVRDDYKVRTLRPNTQGTHDDYLASSGTKPAQTNNTPPSGASISGGPGDRDTVVLGAYSAPSSPPLPFIEAVQYVALGTSSGPDVIPVAREDSTDVDIGDALDLPGTGGRVGVSSALSTTPIEDEVWTAANLASVEFGTRVA